MNIKKGNKYRNWKGTYTVLDVQGDRLFIEYEDGKQSEVSLRRQKRILRNFEKAHREKKPQKKHFSSQPGPVYKNRCWRCGKRLSSNKHQRCSTCGWLKCRCGACKCNRFNSLGALTQ